MKKTIFLSLSVFALLFFAQIDVIACTCVSLSQTLEQEINGRLKDANAVFSGEVIGINKIPKTRKLSIRIQVEESWKDILPEEITVITDLDSCGYPFQVGTTYLVFAHNSDDNNLTTGSCSLNKPIYKAAEELKILGKGKLPQKNKSSSL